MLSQLFKRWADWTGDKRLTDAIRGELRRRGYAAQSAKTRDVRLAAVERPGWVQVYSFRVETTAGGAEAAARREVVLFGVSREDVRTSKIAVHLAEDPACWRRQLDEWSDGLVVRRTSRGTPPA